MASEKITSKLDDQTLKIDMGRIARVSQYKARKPAPKKPYVFNIQSGKTIETERNIKNKRNEKRFLAEKERRRGLEWELPKNTC